MQVARCRGKPPIGGLLSLLAGIVCLLAACAPTSQPVPDAPPTAPIALAQPSPTPLPTTVTPTLVTQPSPTLSPTVPLPTVSPTARLTNPPPTISPTASPTRLPIFDTHLHYNRDMGATLSPQAVLAKLERAGVARALVSSSPDDETRRLYGLAPDRVVPILRPYYDDVNSANWFQMPKVTPYLTERLKTPIYQGIGEFHLTGTAATAPVVRATTRLAVERGLFLHVHADAQAVSIILADQPTARILWAHAGLIEPPATVARMLAEHPTLWADIAIREAEIAPGGKLAAAWRDLFLEYPDRFTIGSDTWVPSRWDTYEQILDFDRQWLAQLPPDIAEKIAYRNAARLFGAGPFLPQEGGR